MTCGFVLQYTFRNEHVFFADNLPTIIQEYQLALDAGVDGLFTDYTEGVTLDPAPHDDGFLF